MVALLAANPHVGYFLYFQNIYWDLYSRLYVRKFENIQIRLAWGLNSKVFRPVYTLSLKHPIV
jgi:hypothetical protein